MQNAEHNRLEMIRLCHSGLDSQTLRRVLLQRLQGVIPFNYAYFSTTDPATGLATSSVLVEEPPSWCMAVFIENEFLHSDFNKFSEMMRQNQAVGMLSLATQNEPYRSSRYRDMLAPMAMKDELRAVFVTDTACWGTLCLHRDKNYNVDEATYLAQLIQPITEGLHKAFLINNAPTKNIPDGPGVMILAEDFSILATNVAADYWLAELAEINRDKRHKLPLIVHSVIAGLKAVEDGWTEAMPKVRLRTRSGHWLCVYASRLKSSANQAQVSVIFEVAKPTEIAPLMMQAYSLTKREGEVTQWVLRGCSTTEIAGQLHISPNTVQDHLKAVFEKVGVSSRGELSARLFIHQHQ